MRFENTWQEIRDHSFIQNHSRPFRLTVPWQCFFSSLHSCSTGFRSKDTWQEIRDHSFIQESLQTLQIHSFFSSVHLTHLLQGSGQRTGMNIAEAWFCAQWPIFGLFFEVCVWIIVQLEDPNMAHNKISNRVSHLLIYICWYLIESMMPCI